MQVRILPVPSQIHKPRQVAPVWVLWYDMGVVNQVTPMTTIYAAAPGAFFGTVGLVGFHTIGQFFIGDRPARVAFFQQLATAEPYSESGSAAARWLLKEFNMRPAPAPLDFAGNALLQELFGYLQGEG